jgi:hypothetical protein
LHTFVLYFFLYPTLSVSCVDMHSDCFLMLIYIILLENIRPLNTMSPLECHEKYFTLGTSSYCLSWLNHVTFVFIALGTFYFCLALACTNVVIIVRSHSCWFRTSIWYYYYLHPLNFIIYQSAIKVHDSKLLLSLYYTTSIIQTTYMLSIILKILWAQYYFCPFLEKETAAQRI